MTWVASQAATELPAWSVLLPWTGSRRVGHLIVLGADAGMVDRLRASGVAETVSTSTQAAAGADVVVRLRGAAESLDDALRCLHPGGVFYGEFKSRRLTPVNAASRAIRRLRQRGLDRVATYWMRSAGGTSPVYVSLTPNALGWYCRNLYRAKTPAQVVHRALLRVLNWGGPGLTGRAVETVCITAAPRHATGGVFVFDSAAGALADTVRNQWPGMVVLGSRNERTIIPAFGTGSRYPDAVLKLATSPEHDRSADRKQELLTELHSLIDSAMPDAVPSPVGLAQWFGRRVSIETGIRGDVLFASRWGRRRPGRSDYRTLSGIVDWLIQFNSLTTTGRVQWRETRESREWKDLDQRFSAAFGPDRQVSDLLRLAAAASGALGDSEMPIVWNHGDFHGGNIFRITKGYAAVDWVDAAPGLPFLDLFKFVEFWHVHVTSSWKAPLRTARFRELFVAERSPNHIVDVVRGEISRYARRLGVPPRLIPVLAVHSWTRLALHHSHLAARGARGHAAPARIFGGHVRALAEGTDVLFTVYE